MGLKNCEIKLDNPWNTYYAGQTIKGQVMLTLDSPKTVRGIIIRFLGEGNTEWNDTRVRTNSDGKEERVTETFTGHEEYFKVQYYLLGAKKGPEIELPAGNHTYDFTCALSPTLPSSFEGEYGHVRYTVKVTLDRPWKFDQDMKMAFTVISPVDLNLNSRVKEPYRLELGKSFCCFCCRSGPLDVVTTVPVTGYVSGQVIPITCECDNNSNVEINSVQFILYKRVTFRTTQPRRDTRENKVKICEASVGPVAASESQTFMTQLKIPALPPTNLSNCSIITLDYDLHVQCKVSGPHRNLSGKIPITLGTIPLASFKSPAPYSDVRAQGGFQRPTYQHDDPSLAPTQPVSPVSPPSGAGGAWGWNVADSVGGQLYPNIPPPQFVETQFKAPQIVGRDDTEFTRIIGSENFAPRYPTFQFTPTAPPLNM